MIEFTDAELLAWLQSQRDAPTDGSWRYFAALATRFGDFMEDCETRVFRLDAMSAAKQPSKN
jgi:hypothetical protein